MTIRLADRSDRAAVYDICLRTGADGTDATGRYTDPELLGHVWAGPYLALEPRLALVLQDEGGVAGYALGAADTATFEDRCEELWWPALRARYRDPVAVAEHRRGPDAQLRHRIHHPPRTPQHLAADYPSHLHIDLLPRTQGRGAGRRLMAALLEALAVTGSTGVHLGTSRRNDRAVGFYRHLGFEELDVPGTDGDTVVMGLRLHVP